MRGDKVSLAADDPFAPYSDEGAMAVVVIDELIRGASEHRRGFGGLTHIINHAAALIELSRFGYHDLARKGLITHRHHVRLWRSLPNLVEELGTLKPAKHDPRRPEFWMTGTLRRDSAQLTHRVKTLYGFFTLMDLIEDPLKRKRAEDRFLYLMA